MTIYGDQLEAAKRQLRPEEQLDPGIALSAYGKEDQSPWSLHRGTDWLSFPGRGNDRTVTQIELIGRAKEVCSEQKQPADVQERLTDSIQKISQRGDISEREKQLVYRDLARIIDPSAIALFDAKSRVNLADQLAWMVANTERNEQGSHPTCGLTMLRSIHLIEEPHIATGLIADIVLTGSFKTASGEIVRPPRDSLNPGPEESTFKPHEAWRTWPGQIYDITAGNIYWNQSTRTPRGESVEKGSVTYEQTQHGERLIHHTSNGNYYLNDADGSVVNHASLNADALMDVYRKVGGKDPDGRIVFFGKATDKQVHGFVDFPAFISEMTNGPRNQLLMVHTSREPFRSEIHSMNSNPSTWHFVLKRGFDAATQTISIDSPGLQGHDHLLPQQRLYAVTVFNASLGAAPQPVQQVPQYYVYRRR